MTQNYSFELRDSSFDIRAFRGKCLIKRSLRQAMTFVILVREKKLPINSAINNLFYNFI